MVPHHEIPSKGKRPLQCPTLGPQEGSRIVWAFARLGAAAPELFARLAEWLGRPEALAAATPQSLVSMAWAYAKQWRHHGQPAGRLPTAFLTAVPRPFPPDWIGWRSGLPLNKEPNVAKQPFCITIVLQHLLFFYSRVCG